MKYERNYGIDLLRLVLMYMVCMLHTLGQGGILGVCQAGTVEYKAFWFLEILSYCAVDGFAIISGYMAVDRPRKYEKLVDMWFQAFFYSFVKYLEEVLFFKKGMDMETGKWDHSCVCRVSYLLF